MRAALYSRYSTELQRDASIEDQVRRCTARAAAEGWEVVGTFNDHARSGADRFRPALQELMQAARDGQFDIVVSEAIDRLSRDQEDIAAFYKQLSFLGIKIVTLAEGEINELHIGMKGSMNALFLKDLAMKTHRGLEGRVRKGRSAGGRAFGYDIVREMDARGEPVRGGRTIDDAEAVIVRRIFKDFAAGRSPAVIARELNQEGIAGPDGRPWQRSAMTGHSRRRSGVLRNEIYIGRLIWNRQRFLKDPRTGKRVSRINPESEWIIEPVPELRIVDDDLWALVAERLGDIEQSPRVRKLRASRFWERRRPGHLLTGLVRCGCCGGAVISTGGDYLACSAARRMATCENRRGIPRRLLEEFILDNLRHHLMAPELVKAFIAEFTIETNRRASDQEVRTKHKGKELADVTRQIDGLISAIADGLRTSGIKAKLEELEHRHASLEAEISAAPVSVPRLHPNLAELYRRKVADLSKALEDPSCRDEALGILRGLIEAVEVHPSADGIEIEFKGAIANMITLTTPSRQKPDDQFAIAVKQVAGT